MTALLLFASSSQALDVERDDIREFIVTMQDQYDYDPEQLTLIMSQAESSERIIKLISKPAEKTKPWFEYRQIFLTEPRIVQGAEFVAENQTALQAAWETYGVEPEIVTAIIGVETYYGDRPGNIRVIDALSTLAFDYPPRQTFFRKELVHYLLLTRDQQLDPLAATGSYAGAMGMPQFMPSSYLSYAKDGNADGLTDIWSEITDVTASVANYLQRHGWEGGMPIVVPATKPASNQDVPAGNALKLNNTVAGLRGMGIEFETDCPGDTPAVLIELENEAGMEYWVGFANYYAITRYNRSRMYAMAVIELAVEIDALRQPD